MKPHHVLAFLLVVVNVLAAAALASLGKLNGDKPGWAQPLTALIVGTAMGQITLAAAWLAWGRALIAIRGAALLAVLVAWLLPVTKCYASEKSSALYGGALLLQAILLVSVLSIIRMAGPRITRSGETPVSTPRLKPWQFTLGGVLSLTTMLAMFLGVGRHFDFPWAGSVRAISFCLANATAGSIAIYAAFRARSVGLSLLAPTLIACIGESLLWTIYGTERSFPTFIGMGILHGTVISLSSGVLRVAGYKLTSKPASISDDVQDGSSTS